MESQQTERDSASHPEVSWDDLETPGFYVSRATGNGYRVPTEALVKGASPVIQQVSAQLFPPLAAGALDGCQKAGESLVGVSVQDFMICGHDRGGAVRGIRVRGSQDRG